ncbi:hypothetical protein V8C86DRAFT_2780193 [Haematococcus lacustris]
MPPLQLAWLQPAPLSPWLPLALLPSGLPGLPPAVAGQPPSSQQLPAGPPLELGPALLPHGPLQPWPPPPQLRRVQPRRAPPPPAGQPPALPPPAPQSL